MIRPALPFTIVTLVVATVGIIDTAIDAQWRHFAMFLVVAVIQAAVLLTASGNRVPVSLRPDLARWASERSHRTGEPVNDVIDRSVAWFQHGLYGASQADGE